MSKGIVTRGQIAAIMMRRECLGGENFTAKPTPGKRTLKNLLETALLPMGSTLYIYGGGWNEADDGAGIEARTIGLSPRWKAFYDENDAFYDHKTHNYLKNQAEIHNGLDCSGYVGWILYNVLETENGKPGYVMSATKMAKAFAGYGWGSYADTADSVNYHPGDIVSQSGHVLIALGTMNDGSMMLMHCSPAGPMISGTYTPDGKADSEAIALAVSYMAKYFPDFYSRYPEKISRTSAYFTNNKAMTWYLDGSGVLTDPDGYSRMTPAEILRDLFGE